jgi:hypothetical protein
VLITSISLVPSLHTYIFSNVHKPFKVQWLLHVTYFNTKNTLNFFSECVNVLRIILTINNGYFLKQRKPAVLYNRDFTSMILKLIFKYYLDELYSFHRKQEYPVKRIIL